MSGNEKCLCVSGFTVDVDSWVYYGSCGDISLFKVQVGLISGNVVSSLQPVLKTYGAVGSYSFISTNVPGTIDKVQKC